MPVDKIRYFPPLGWGVTQKGVGEYFEDYPTFVYKADVGGFQEKKSGYIATWDKTAFVTQCAIILGLAMDTLRSPEVQNAAARW